MKALLILAIAPMLLSCGKPAQTKIELNDGDILVFKLYTVENYFEYDNADYIEYDEHIFRVALTGDEVDVYVPMANIEYWGIDK